MPLTKECDLGFKDKEFVGESIRIPKVKYSCLYLPLNSVVSPY
jgi:hypothetical protein